MKVRIWNRNGKIFGYMIFCPGCKWEHLLDLGWTFNGNLEKPTFSPSLLVHNSPPPDGRCHSFIADGKIRFLDDCTHELKGQTVGLPDVEFASERLPHD